MTVRPMGAAAVLHSGSRSLETALAGVRGSGLSIQAATTYLASEIPGVVADDAASVAVESRKEAEALFQEARTAQHVTSLIRQAEHASGRYPLTLIDALRLLAERGSEEAQHILGHPE